MNENKISDLFINNLIELPIWVKQALYKRTNENLRQTLDKYLDVFNSEVLVQDIVPKITYKGKQITKGVHADLTQDDIAFLQATDFGYSIFDITVTNFWSLEYTCKIMAKLIKLEYLEDINDFSTLYIFEFISGKIKTGDVLKKLGIVTVFQIEEALRVQQEKKKNGINQKIADIMISLGYITNNDVDILLKLKEDSKKRLVMSLGLTTIYTDNPELKNDTLNKIQKEFKKVVQENEILKNRLFKLLNLRK